MTTTTSTIEVLQQDSRGRVLIGREGREALLEEFFRSGLSAAAFARMAGIKYPTFANWVHQRRKAQGTGGGKAPVRFLEAVVDGRPREVSQAKSPGGLVVELPGGCRVQVETPVQMTMAAELINLVAQTPRARC